MAVCTSRSRGRARLGRRFERRFGRGRWWRDTQAIIKCALTRKRRNNRNFEDDILIFLNVYEIPPYDYVKQFLKINNEKYEMIDHIVWMLLYRRREGCDVKEDIKSYIESKKFNVKNTVRDVNAMLR